MRGESENSKGGRPRLDPRAIVEPEPFGQKGQIKWLKNDQWPSTRFDVMLEVAKATPRRGDVLCTRHLNMNQQRIEGRVKAEGAHELQKSVKRLA